MSHHKCKYIFFTVAVLNKIGSGSTIGYYDKLDEHMSQSSIKLEAVQLDSVKTVFYQKMSQSSIKLEAVQPSNPQQQRLKRSRSPQ